MNGDGVLDDTGWISRDDGFLVIDRNNDGKITEASELSLAAEDNAASDLAGLARLDSNGDGVVDATDARFGELKIWVDANRNGSSDTGELHTLADFGIVSFSLKDAAASASQSLKLGSNALLATATFKRSDGTTGTLGDVSLAYKPGKEAAATDWESLLSGRGGLLFRFARLGSGLGADLDVEDAIATLSSSRQASATSIFDLPSDPEAFDAFVSGASAAMTSGTAVSTSTGQALAALDTEVSDTGYTVTPLVEAAADGIDTSRLLALLRQNMAGFGASSGLDAQEWKGAFAARSFEFM